MKNNGFKIFFIVMLLILVAIWAEIAKSPDNNCSKIYFFDVGQGDATMIVKDDYEILIDGGPDNKVLVEIGNVMPLGDKKIEAVILTHPHADHVVGLNQILENYQIEKVYISGVLHTSNQYLEFLQKIKDSEIATEVPELNYKFEPFEGAFLEFLWPGNNYNQKEAENLNNSSLLTRFCYLEKCAVFMGDQETDEQEIMFANNKEADYRADILKVSHHGSSNGTNQKLLDAIQPKYAIISVGADNRYGHPHVKTLDLLNKFGIKLFRTDRDGTVEMVFEQNNIIVKTP